MTQSKLQPAAAKTPIPAGHRIRGAGDEAEKYCVRCDDWWPATPEYFFRAQHGEGGLFYCCKACFADWRLTHPRKSQARGAKAPWQPMETAPHNGTEIELLLHHPNRQYAQGDDKRMWEQAVRAKWIDFNGGGWTWHGMYGIAQGWRAAL